MKNLIRDEPQKIESVADADKKFQIWDVRIFGDRRDEELHKQSLIGQIETLKEVIQFVTNIRAKFNQALTWVLAAGFGALGLWLFNRLTMGG